MDCHEIKERISEYIDGMLPAEVSAEVKAHIGRCEECREEYESISNVIGHMKQMDSVEEPEDFVEKVSVQLDKGYSFRNVFRRLFVPVRIKIPLEAAAIAAVAVLFFYVAGVRDSRAPDVINLTLTERLSEVRGHKKADPPEPKGKKGPKRERSIAEVIDSVGGRVIEVDLDDGTGEPKWMVIELRAGNFPALWRELNTLAVIDEPLPQLPGDEDKVIRITITLSPHSNH